MSQRLNLSGAMSLFRLLMIVFKRAPDAIGSHFLAELCVLPRKLFPDWVLKIGLECCL